MIFPENFDLLHQGEEFIRARSKEAIQASETLPHHFNIVADSMTLIDHFARGYHHKNEDQLIIQLLGVRLFNGLASSIRNMLAGYYQNSVMQQRDLLEVSFLLDYFSTNPALIGEWKGSTESERNKRFGAFHVRKVLDDRDAFTERNRGALQTFVQSGCARILSGLSNAPAGCWRRRALRTLLRRTCAQCDGRRAGEDRCVCCRQLHNVFHCRSAR